ncbi:MAG: lipocalin-like domain-containing protein [Gammaproteobacteria bacterium]
MRGLLSILLLMLVTAAWADDVYQILRQGSEGFAEALPGKTLEFPRDHLPHPEYRIEWWYLTANLSDSSGRDWGLHWTLFRQALNADGNPQGWNSNQVWMAHAALSTPDGHVYEQRFARGGIAQAGVELNNGRFEAWLDDWLLQGDGPEPLPGVLSIQLRDISAQFHLRVETPWVLHGDQGYSQKSAQGQASYYYSQPHIQVDGLIERPGESIAISGLGWLDREWSSQPLADNQPGWDWFSLHLNDGSALMVYRLRHTDPDKRTLEGEGGNNDWLSGTWISPDGEAEALSAEDIRLRPLEYRPVLRKQQEPVQLPLVWSLALPVKGPAYQWLIRAPDPNHWLSTAYPYWEGPIVADGDNPGVGFLEMTGY